MDALKFEFNTYTYADYAKWDTTDRYELIGGMPFMMAAPSTAHQEVVGEIYHQLKALLKGSHCRPYVSPIDVCLSGKGERDNTVVQPDVLVVCDRSKITEKFINGAPDFVVEVLSPSNRSEVLVYKFNRYLWAGVKEFWVVDLETKSVTVFLLNGNKFEGVCYQNPEKIPVTVLSNCEIDMREAFNYAEIINEEITQ